MKHSLKSIGVCFCVTLLLCCISSSSYLLTLQTDAPGNLFTETQTIAFTVSDAKGPVRFSVSNYWGTIVKSGTAKQRNKQSLITLKNPGLGYYTVICHDDADTVSTALGVVIDRKNAPLPRDGRVCGETAAAWIVKNDGDFEPIAQMVKLAGIPWVREGINWSAIEQTEGTYNWGRYKKAIDAMHAQGIYVCVMWSDSPSWTQPKGVRTWQPEDLRTLYRFAKAASAEFKDTVQAWEIGNEPDMNGIFWFDLGDKAAGFHKAAYLGLKDGNPGVLVLPASFTLGPATFMRNMFDSGIGDYTDIFNWHVYDSPLRYPLRKGNYVNLISDYGLANIPDWLTEFGSVYTTTEGPDHMLLSEENQRKQCRSLGQSVTMALVSDVDKMFYFIIPASCNGPYGDEFGLLRPDLTPYPGFVALSTAANFLGNTSYAGEYKTENDKVHAQIFKNSGGNVIVAWADESCELQVKTNKKSVQTADVFGKKRTIKAREGVAGITIGPEIVYIFNCDLSSQTLKPASPIPVLPQNNPSRIITVGYCNLPIGLESDCYLAMGETPYTVDVYNFDDTKPATGTIEIVLSKGMKGENLTQNVSLPPMGKTTLTFTLSGRRIKEIQTAIVLGHFEGQNVSPSASYFKNFFVGSEQFSHE